MTELAMVLPVFLVVALVGVDFGRAFQAWVGLQNMARIGANYASSSPTAWNTPGLPQSRQRYQDLVRADLSDLGCTLPAQVLAPAFPSGLQVGSPAVSTVTCSFTVLTPLVGAILPSPFNISATSTFPIRAGAVTGTQSNGPSPGAAFTASPTSGQSPLTVNFSDNNTTGTKPSAWCWNFGDGPPQPTCEATSKTTAHTYTCTNAVIGFPNCTFPARLRTTSIYGSSTWSTVPIAVTAPPPVGPAFVTTPNPAAGPPPLVVQFNDSSTGGPTSWCWNFGYAAIWPACVTTLQNPSHSFNSTGTFTVRLCAWNASGPSQPCASPATTTVTVSFATPPPGAGFTFFPTTGTAPLAVNFTDTSTNSPTAWSWTFGAGQGSSTARNPSWTYFSPGTYAVNLVASNAAGSTSISQNVVINAPMCTTPNFINLGVRTTANITTIQNLWSGAGFTGLISWSQPVPTGTNRRVVAQSISGLRACTSGILLTIG